MAVAVHNSPLVPAFNVVINKAPLADDLFHHIRSVVVDESVALPSMFTLELLGSDAQAERTPWLEKETLFALGDVVEIKLGYQDDLERVIVGEIVALEPDFTLHSLPVLTVIGFDRRHRLQRGRKTRTYVQQKDSEIATQIADAVSLTPEVEDSRVIHDYVLQSNQTDWEFLCDRAQRIGYEVLVVDRTLLFRPIANAQSEEVTLSMASGEHQLVEFHPRLSSVGQASEVAVRGWNIAEKEAFTARAGTGNESAPMGSKNTGSYVASASFGDAVNTVNHRPLSSQAEADQWAQARLDQASLGLLTGEGICFGRTDLRAGKVVQIEGIGRRFNGPYYVTSVTHRYTSHDGYRTHFTVRRNAT